MVERVEDDEKVVGVKVGVMVEGEEGEEVKVVGVKADGMKIVGVKVVGVEVVGLKLEVMGDEELEVPLALETKIDGGKGGGVEQEVS